MEEKIVIKNDNNEEKEFDILFTFESKETKKKYVTYTDYSKDYKGKIKCWSSYYEGNELKPVETETELKIIDKMLRTLSKS
ncbi:MAG: DUF1292 domain-containing protein, partial [Bacilli bacterium]|nr:DUF1292 domain-containing protein [Bacilli bacterium]